MSKDKVAGKKVISWSLVQKLIYTYHVCPFCFRKISGEELILKLKNGQKHPLANDDGYISFSYFAVHNYCSEHGCLTGDCIIIGDKRGFLTGAASAAESLGWEIDFDT